jgi:hypothetical protein
LRKVGWIVFGTALVFAACSGNGSTPATAPPTSPGPSSTVATTITQLPTTSLVATTTTTVDSDRVAEIETILEVIELGVRQAEFDRDEGAFSRFYLSNGFFERVLPSFLESQPEIRPTWAQVEVFDIYNDDEDCIAVRAENSWEGGTPYGRDLVQVLERLPNGDWGISFIGKGWQCDGPHPLP